MPHLLSPRSFPLPLLFFCCSLSLAGVSACGTVDDAEDDSVDAAEEEPSLAEGPGAFAADFRNSANFFSLMSDPVAGTSPHGTVQIWYSTNIRELVEQGSEDFTVPAGTVAIKTGDMEGDGVVDAITVMVKETSGFDKDNQDWRYEMRTPDGAVMTDESSGMPMSGSMQMCIACHSAYAGRDYLAGTTLR